MVLSKIKKKPYNIIAIILTSFILIIILRNRTYMYIDIKEERNCSVQWKTLASENKKAKIAMVSLTDSNILQNKTTYNKERHRDFKNMLEITWENKKSYALKHGYEYINASMSLDTSRPPAWSKIVAIKNSIKKYDWLFWLDSDTLIMNNEFKLENIIPDDSDTDLIITIDSTGYNSGVWFMRNTDWSYLILNMWWSLDRFVEDTNFNTKSGDNDALKYLLKLLEDTNKMEFNRKIKIATQCTFNSYIWKHTIRNWLRYLFETQNLINGLYQKGDFILHFAGIEKKLDVIKATLNELEKT